MKTNQTMHLSLTLAAILAIALLWGILTATTANAQIPTTWMAAGGTVPAGDTSLPARGSGVMDDGNGHASGYADCHGLAPAAG